MTYPKECDAKTITFITTPILGIKGIFAGWPASNNNDCHLLLGEKFSFIGTVTTKRLLLYNFIRYSLSRQNWFKEIRGRKNDKSRRFTQGFIDKFGNKFLFWLVCYCCVGLLLFLVLDAHWSNSEKIKSNMAAVEWKIQRAGEVSLFYLLNKTSTISWARVKFSLSFLTERFNFQAHPYLKKLLVEILSMNMLPLKSSSSTQNLRPTLF